MDCSTNGVTLLTAFVFDVLREYVHLQRVAAPAFRMAEGISDQPDSWCSIDIYNNVCQWIEANIGAASIRKAGMAIGARAYDNAVAHSKLTNPTPLAMMEALKWAASVMIRDPNLDDWCPGTLPLLDSHAGLLKEMFDAPADHVVTYYLYPPPITDHKICPEPLGFVPGACFLPEDGAIFATDLSNFHEVVHAVQRVHGGMPHVFEEGSATYWGGAAIRMPAASGSAHCSTTRGLGASAPGATRSLRNLSRI